LFNFCVSRGGIHIIDLQKTVVRANKAALKRTTKWCAFTDKFRLTTDRASVHGCAAAVIEVVLMRQNHPTKFSLLAK